MKDLPNKLRIKASMIELGERIAWGSEAVLMKEAANKIEELEAELAAIKSAPVVMPERLTVPMPIWKDVRQPYGDPLNAVRIGEVTHFNLALDEIARLNRSKT